MNPIAQTPSGAYVDLSRIVAIDNVEGLPSKYDIKIGFDIYFNPEGVPFLQDKSVNYPLIIMKISIYKNYKKDAIEGSLDSFVEECRKDWETKRLEFIEIWKTYKTIF